MQRLKVTEEHLKLLRRAYFRYEHQVEFGAPGMDQKRPYGNSYVYGDIAEILGIEGTDEGFTNDQYDYMLTLHRELATVLNIMVRNGGVEPGVYVADDYRQNWSKE